MRYIIHKHIHNGSYTANTHAHIHKFRYVDIFQIIAIIAMMAAAFICGVKCDDDNRN